MDAVNVTPVSTSRVGEATNPDAAAEANDGGSHPADLSAPSAPPSDGPPPPSAAALVISASDKAGMDGIDRPRINSIILRESGDSSFMMQQRRRDAALEERIEAMRRKVRTRDATVHPGGAGAGAGGWRRPEERAADAEIDGLNRRRPTKSTCVVVDMDGFYISCETLSRPELRDVPACVGMGMICTSNYRARRYGVRSAMAGFIGDKLVSELSGGKERLIHVPNNFDLYRRKAAQVRATLAEYDPNLRAYSLDEAYLDIGPYLELRVGRGWEHRRVVSALASKREMGSKTWEASKEVGNIEVDADGACDEEGDPAMDVTDGYLDYISSGELIRAAAGIVKEMRAKVERGTGGLTCSAGLASNFMLAKIASDKNKPNGQLLIGPSNDEIISFIKDFPVRKVPGIGRVTEKILNAFGIKTVQQLHDERAVIRLLFKPASAGFLLRASIGWSNSDPSEVEKEPSVQKGISRERTFQPGKSWDEEKSKLEEITQSLAEDMKKKDIRAHTITLKVKLHTFDVLSRSKSMIKGVYLQSANIMAPIAAQMLADLRMQHKGTFSVRLLGVRCSNFQGENDKAEEASQPNIQKFLFKRDSKEAGTTKHALNSTPLKSVCVQSDEKVDQNDCASPEITDISLCSPKKIRLTADFGKEGTKDCRFKQEEPECLKPSPFTHNSRAVLYPSSHMQGQELCPICNASLPKNNDALNRHIDLCSSPLSPSTILLSRRHMKCPVCDMSIAGDNDVLNSHIDACLNGTVVRRIVREDSNPANGRHGKKRLLTDFFYC